MDNQSMVILFILSILVIMIAMHLNNNRKQKKRIQQKWGTIPTETRMDSEESLNQSYEKLKTSLDFDSEVDDITWYDLDLFEVFKEINHTYSSVGSEALYRRLRLFNFNDQDQNRIEKLIAFYDENPKTREKIEFNFARLGKKRSELGSSLFNRFEKERFIFSCNFCATRRFTYHWFTSNFIWNRRIRVYDIGGIGIV